MIFCKDQGHLRIDTLESTSIDMEGQLWESPTSRLAEDMPGETLGELDYLSWKGPLCLSTQTLELQITLLPSGDIQVPDGHSLPGLSRVSGI